MNQKTIKNFEVNGLVFTLCSFIAQINTFIYPALSAHYGGLNEDTLFISGGLNIKVKQHGFNQIIATITPESWSRQSVTSYISIQCTKTDKFWSCNSGTITADHLAIEEGQSLQFNFTNSTNFPTFTLGAVSPRNPATKKILEYARDKMWVNKEVFTLM